METLSQNWKLLVIEGILFVLLGCFAIAAPNVFTLSTELLIGSLFLIAGVMQIIRSFSLRESGLFAYVLIGGLLAAVAGGWLLLNPIQGIITLTVLMSIFFLIDGIVKIVQSLQMRDQAPWIWVLISGIFGIALAVLIWVGWPGTAVWFLGLYLGIYLLMLGWSLIAIAISLK